MYEVKKASQLRKFFRHNCCTETAMYIILDWLEEVNANFKDEEDFNKRMPRLIEKYIVSTTEISDDRKDVARAYFGARDFEAKWKDLEAKNLYAEKEKKKAQETKRTIHIKNAEESEEPKKQEQTKKTHNTEKIYENGNMGIYKTTIGNDPAIMILLRNYSTDSLLKMMVTEMIKDLSYFF